MASVDLMKEMKCPVCENVCQDPITLKCGHNFCRDFIGLILDAQEEFGSYYCPECKEEFQERPAPQRNITPENVLPAQPNHAENVLPAQPNHAENVLPAQPNHAENVLPAQPNHEQSKVLCTYCIHAPVPALKSCVLCEASLCDDHLRVHSKAPEHVLCDPTTSPEGRKCSVHKEILKYYCTEDSTCICVSCSLAGEHRRHQVETLEEASEKKKKKLRNVLQKLITERETMEKRVQSLEEHMRKVQGQADVETERVTALFRDLKRRLEDLEKRVLMEIAGQAKWTSIHVSDKIQELQIKKEELPAKIRRVEELCNMMDPLTVLQQPDTGDLCDTEDGHDGDTYDDGGGLDVEGVSHILHTGLRDIMSGVNRKKRPGTHVSPHSSAKKGLTTSKLSRPRPKTSKPSKPRSTTSKPSKPRSKTSKPSKPRSTTSKPSEPCPKSNLTIQHYLQAGGPNVGSVGQTSGLLHTLRTGLLDLMSGVNVQKRPGTHVSPHSSTLEEDPTTAEPSRPRPPSTNIVQHSYHQAGGPNIRSVEQTSGVTNILLDVNTANNNLLISDDGKTATWTHKKQNRPETLQRFQGCPQVLSTQRFSSGRHSWEVDVGGAKSWTIGVCYPSIERRGSQSEIGENKKSWGLERSGDRYTVTHDRKEFELPAKIFSTRIRIVLDYEAGRISFYDLSDPIRLLHTLATTFTEPLHAGLYVGKGCIKI